MTDLPPLLPGQFVWCSFPFREQPDRPGPERHIAYVVDVLRKDNRLMIAAALYTTTRPWPRGQAIPFGVIPVAPEIARRMRQEAFVVDARRIAYMPLDERFFPDLGNPDRGVRGVAPRELRERIERALVKLLADPALLEFLGPERPQRPKRPGKRPSR